MSDRIKTREQLNQVLDDLLIAAWRPTFVFVQNFGRGVLFFARGIRMAFRRPNRFDEIIKHMEFIGNKSILIIALTGAFTGMALAYQIYLGFKIVNATNLVGPTVALGIARELGPVLTGLIVAARAGGAMAARLGTMRVSEQIDAIEVMGVDPVQYLVSPRIVAALICMPLLCGVFDFVSMLGAHALGVQLLELDEAIFWDKIRAWVKVRDIYEGLFKAGAFGVTFASICTYMGYNASGGAKGVGEATNRGVVNSMVLIIVINFFLTNIVRFFYLLFGVI